MKGTTCDCPACLVFWAAHNAQNNVTPKDHADQLSKVIDSEPEREGPGCVKHLLAGDMGHWKQLGGNDE